MQDKILVSVKKIYNIDNPEEMRRGLLESLELLGGLGKFIKAGEKIVLKPNLAVGSMEGVTSPLIIDFLIEEIKKLGAIPIVADGSSKSVDYDTLSIVKVTGLGKILEKHGVEFVDLDNTPTVRKKVPDGKAFKYINVPEVILEADKLINMPKIKTHHLTGISCGIKNLQGIVAGYEKLMTHALGLHQPLADLPKIFKPDLTIVDGTSCMEGFGPFYGKKVPLGLIISSENILAAEAVVCRIMNVRYSSIKHIGLCFKDHNFKPSDIRVVGENIKKIDYKFSIPSFKKNYLFLHRSATMFDRFIYKYVADIFHIPLKSIFPSMSRIFGVHLKVNQDFDQARINPLICPVGAIKKKENGKYTIDLHECVDCLKCYKELPKGAIILKGLISSQEK